MRIAVVQHQLRPAPAQDLEALVLAASHAAADGADLVCLPNVVALTTGPLADDLIRRLDDEVPAPVLVAGVEEAADPGEPEVRDYEFGRVAVLVGDRCMDARTLALVAESGADILLLAPGSESELQAEAVLELAIGLSTSVASLVAVVEPDGAELGVAGHGGSALVYLGEVLAEAMAGDDVLVADVVAPIGAPEPRSPLPQIPPLLAGRLAAHEGRKPEVDYPADLA